MTKRPVRLERNAHKRDFLCVCEKKAVKLRANPRVAIVRLPRTQTARKILRRNETAGVALRLQGGRWIC